MYFSNLPSFAVHKIFTFPNFRDVAAARISSESYLFFCAPGRRRRQFRGDRLRARPPGDVRAVEKPEPDDARRRHTAPQPHGERFRHLDDARPVPHRPARDRHHGGGRRTRDRVLSDQPRRRLRLQEEQGPGGRLQQRRHLRRAGRQQVIERDEPLPVRRMSGESCGPRPSFFPYFVGSVVLYD